MFPVFGHLIYYWNYFIIRPVSSGNHDCSSQGAWRGLPWEPRLASTFITAPQRVYSDRLHHSIRFGSFDCTGLETAGKHCKASIKKFTGTDLLLLYDVFITRCIRKAQSIIKDTSHPAHTLFSLLPSGKCYWSIKSRTTRYRDGFFPQVVTIMNSTTHTYICTHTHTDTKTLPTTCIVLCLLCIF